MMGCWFGGDVVEESEERDVKVVCGLVGSWSVSGAGWWDLGVGVDSDDGGGL